MMNVLYSLFRSKWVLGVIIGLSIYLIMLGIIYKIIPPDYDQYPFLCHDVGIVDYVSVGLFVSLQFPGYFLVSNFPSLFSALVSSIPVAILSGIVTSDIMWMRTVGILLLASLLVVYLFGVIVVMMIFAVVSCG